MKLLHTIFSIKTESPINRIQYLDFARGILIFLVLYQHSGAPLNTYVLQFHMPALFLLSGYTEFVLDKKTNLLEYTKSKFFRLIVPYFCFEILQLVLFTLIKCFSGQVDFSFIDAVISIATCINNSYVGLYGRLWFLPAIFVSSVLSYIIRQHIAKNNVYIVSMFCAFMLAASYIFSEIIPQRIPFTIDIACLGTVFFLLGHICGNAIKYIVESKKHWIIVIVSTVFVGLFVLCNTIARPYCYMCANDYKDFPFMIVAATSGTAITLITAKYALLLFNKLTFPKNLICWYSVNSLTAFPVHLTIKVLSLPLLRLLGLNNWICSLAVMLTLTIPAVNIINKFFPFMLGKFRYKKN